MAHLGDMDIEEFRAAAHRVADLAADYLAHVEERPVVPAIEPGAIRGAIPAAAPSAGEPFARILEDYLRLVEPHVTHWQHPGFMAYFPSVASAPGILGEWLAATLNSNVMFWKNAPASTEVEEVVVAWLRGMLGLPDAFDGMLTDTASVSSLLAVVAARHAVPGLDATEQGLAGRAEVGPLRAYVSAEAHSSIDKAAIVAGIGRAGVRRIAVDTEFRMRPEALSRAIAEDRARGDVPFLVVATLGTTSSTSIDPIAEVADVAAGEGLWLHADAAYGGAAALVPELRRSFAGWERADSVVFNPHKWMLTPFDASLLLFRRPDVFRGAFRWIPDYLEASVTDGAHNFSE
jgi:aromatic-L-amino-acid decarboxylase